MIKEHQSLDYALRILSILGEKRGLVSAADLGTELEGSSSYIAKVLSRMSGAGLLKSHVSGYELARPLEDLTLADVLGLCRATYVGEYTGRVTDQLMALAADVPLQAVL